MSHGIAIRRAGPEDAETVHAFVCALARYEREPDAVEATPEAYRAQMAAERAWPSFNALDALRCMKTLSTATTSGRYSEAMSLIERKISRSRSGKAPSALATDPLAT